MPAADTPHFVIKEAVVSTLKTAALEGIEDRVYNQVWPDPLLAKFPCLFVTTEGEQEEMGDGTTEHDDTGYPVRVFLADVDTAARHERQALYLDRRRRAIQCFRGDGEIAFRSLVPRAYKIDVRPRAVFDPEGAEYKYVVGSFVLLVWHRQLKGT